MSSPSVGALELPTPTRAPHPGGQADLLGSRRSTKAFDGSRPLVLSDLAAVLWATAGETDGVRRVCASARATHPVAVSVIAGDVRGLASGVHRYLPAGHRVVQRAGGEHRPAMAAATLDAGWLADCPAILVLTVDPARARDALGDQPAEEGA